MTTATTSPHPGAAALHKLAVAVDEVIERVGAARCLLYRLAQVTPTVNADAQYINDLLEPAGDAGRMAADILREWGSVPETAILPAVEGADLSALATLDTPEARQLLALLEAAQAVAERVDAQRGHCVPADTPLLPGESRGTDLAESLSLLTLRVRREVEGARGRE